MMAKRRINSKDVGEIFGLDSKIFKESLTFLKKNAENGLITEFKKNFENWKKNFDEIYGEPSLASNLFLKHTYFVLILKSLILIKLANKKNLKLDK
ncbi:MAG: hypothetical protein EU532_11170, partial [Promethearchaeota archaeon]